MDERSRERSSKDEEERSEDASHRDTEDAPDGAWQRFEGSAHGAGREYGEMAEMERETDGRRKI